MDVIITLFYCLFTACVIYPPTEFVTAGFTIPQIFEGLLDSENGNFLCYHMRRISLTIVAQAFLPLGYWYAILLGGCRSEWLLFAYNSCWMLILWVLHKMIIWWEHDMEGHPVVKSLLPYVSEEGDWKDVALILNREFKDVDKVTIQLRNTSKIVATQQWLIKVSQYRIEVVKQSECTLVATATDSHNISAAGDDEVQYVNVKVISSREDVKSFSFRITTTALRDLQPWLLNPVSVPDHLNLLPTMIEKFVSVFKDYVMQNPEYIPPEDEEIEQCMGCLQEQANVKIERSCLPPPPHLVDGPLECQPCRCRVVWCVACMARWWASRAGTTPPAHWLAGRCTCPVCRATFCMLDVHPVPTPAPAPAPDPAPAPRARRF